MQWRSTATALILSTHILACWAQTPSIRSQITCRSTAGDVFLQTPLEVVSISAEEAVSFTRGVKPLPYEGFDDSRFAVSKLTFYLKRTVTRSSQWPEDNAELGIVFSASSPSGLSWYQIRVAETGSSEPLKIERTSSHASERESGVGRVTIVRATPDPAIPVLNISFHTNNDGVNTQADTQTMLVLDVRQSPPKLITALDCTNLQGGGACTAIDNTFVTGATELVCDWHSETQNYTCEKQYDESYGRRIKAHFALPGNTPLAFHASQGQPETLVDFATRIRDDGSWATRRPSIPGLGETTFLFRTSSGKPPAYLFGARGRGDDFNARFFAVLLGNDAPEILEIRPEAMVDWHVQQTEGQEATTNTSAKDIAPAEMLSGQPVSFVVKKLEAPKSAEVWQVTVTEGDHHAVNWIAAIPKGTSVTFDSLKIASDGVSYGGCGRWIHEQTALTLRQKDSKPEAEAEVEPPFTDPLSREGENDSDVDELCPVLVTIQLVAKDGFHVQNAKTLRCPKERRSVKISEDGVIAPTPYVNPADQ